VRLQATAKDLARFSKAVKFIAFKPFTNAADALEQVWHCVLSFSTVDALSTCVSSLSSHEVAIDTPRCPCRSQVNAISESQTTDELKGFLELNLPKVGGGQTVPATTYALRVARLAYETGDGARGCGVLPWHSRRRYHHPQVLSS